MATALRPQHAVVACLASVAVSLILVGLVSATLIRHLIQILPVVAALGAVARQPRWGAYAAMAVCLFWLAIMTLIWLYLLGIARIVGGHFSAAEIVLTLVIGVSSIWGIVAAARVRPAAGLAARAVALLAFAALQIGAMWVSLLQPFANR